ncbi:MAG: 6-carboxytetrahydropterin synthase QueD [Deltaproteobacteria bacterium]|nr:MAG: 6-carboxytetrahydropterin synthase QueD [Deltaproteobacteria bacterium]
MAECFIVSVRIEFSGAHQLHGYDGPCARMHGHNWVVEADVAASALDEIGMAVDFRALRGAMTEIASRFEHRVLNEVPPFTERNPTAENVARHFHEEIAAWLAGRPDAHRLRLHAVTVWENGRSKVRYMRKDSGGGGA